MSNKKEKQEKQLRLDEKMTRGVARWSAAFGLSFQHILINTGARFMPLAAGTVFAFGVYEFVQALGYAAWSAPVAAAVAIANIKLMQKEHIIENVGTDSKLFKSITPPFQVGLYHSWAVNERSIHASGLIYSESDILMAAEWIDEEAFGLQFHPESIMTPNGDKILENWINLI